MGERTTLRSFASDARSGRGALAIASAASVGAAASGLLIPWLAGRGLTELFAGDEELFLLLAAIIGALALRLVFDVASVLWVGRERYRLVAAIRKRWHDRMLAIAPGSEGDTRRQQWVSLLSYDVPRVADVLVSLPVSAVQATVTLVGALGAMALISPTLTLIVGAGAPLAYFAARLVVRQARKRAVGFWDAEIEAMTAAEESFRARPIIQAFRRESAWIRQFGKLADATTDAGVHHLRLLAFIGPITQFVSFCGIVGIVWFGTSVMAIALEPGELLSFVLYGLLLSQPLRVAADGWASYQEATATLGRFNAVGEPPSFGDREELPTGHDLLIDHVAFSWGETEVLADATLRVRQGEHIALVGENGAGKSTLVALLLGFAPVASGTIDAGGVPLDTLTSDARRRLFAVVPQEGLLVSGTLRDNVAFARPEASDDKIWEALEIAAGARFVREQPDGLDTVIREDGRNLSGGQRQRIAVARALLTDAPIVIFDEAASAYDPDAKRDVIDRCRTALADRTVIWITHEDAPLGAVDRIIKLHGGRFASRPAAISDTGS